MKQNVLLVFALLCLLMIGAGATYFLLSGSDGDAAGGPELATAEEGDLAPADEGPLELPDGSSLDLIDYHVNLQAEKADKAVGNVDLLGLTDEGQLAVVVLKFVSPEATRGTTGETPLRALLEGLAYAAILSANQEAIAAEAKSELGEGTTITLRMPIG